MEYNQQRNTKYGLPNQNNNSTFLGWMSSCSGVGVFSLYGLFVQEKLLFHFIIKGGRDLRNCFTSNSETKDSVETKLKQYLDHSNFAPVTLPFFLKIVYDAVTNTNRLNLSLPSRAYSTLRDLCSVLKVSINPQQISYPLEEIKNLNVPLKINEEELFPPASFIDLIWSGRPEYSQSWYFDEPDFELIKVYPPDYPLNQDETIVKEIASFFGQEPIIKRRLINIVSHMALYHYWRGEFHEAKYMAATADNLQDHFSTCSIVLLMIMRSSSIISDHGGLTKKGKIYQSSRTIPKSIECLSESPYGPTLQVTTLQDKTLVYFIMLMEYALDSSFQNLISEIRPNVTRVFEMSVMIAKLFTHKVLSNYSNLRKSVDIEHDEWTSQHILKSVKQEIVDIISSTCNISRKDTRCKIVAPLYDITKEHIFYAIRELSGKPFVKYVNEKLKICDGCKKSELQEGIFKACGGCLKVVYCSKKCQQIAWMKHHQLHCIAFQLKLKK